ncbi:S1-C subfamily serine protease [Breznakia sp. PF5-3]|uniref:S1C family serine protease n=1 Tax=unclassified Breznakia TaxID=2623764 RepID=UPI002406DFAF|nr:MULTISPECIES: trypsin-like peptidase domain-containing protein [unclassified Breznakia]MDL2276100.1 trypsin-like peptidase domain-containing protein [Breznakia sp. OttesenSCG-928-G09]MDF9823876.1 S1-C subfamily serine protease [Breznakia sp. PM6-1]MDF9834675.1 S1-C subfamily serine protease [Breznakia sp. PF5-3]MDF9836890.1 S1-C subfamily serine protease [Breznakia sp. PFB2-8]MDF9858907.1 S1-C subfamily serine protease [Breznakia sp. PH5-24]
MDSKVKKIMRRTIAYIAIFVVAIVGGFLGNTIADVSFGSKEADLDVVKTNSNSKNTTDVTKIAEKSSKSVVEIKTETMSRDRFFGNYVSEGAGSGVIISENGYIVTNYHVLSGASSVTVTLHDGKEYEAEYIGGDSENDIAVLKIKANDLTPATIGNSDNLVVGEEVLAIGNPLGELGGTVTDGIISSTSREISVDGVTMELLQTSAAINPGNSGGGLFNMQGELIGIVNAKSSGSDIEGLGFAIPSNTAIEIAEKIVDAYK